MKTILPLAFLFFLAANCSYAQPPEWAWGRTSVATSDVEAHSIATDPFGNVYCAGWYWADATFGSVSLNYSGNGEMFIVKYDSSGNVLWAQSAGGTGFDEPRSIACDASGNVYVTGLFDGPSMSAGAFTLTNADSTSTDIFVIKYDSSGNVIWAQSAGSADREFAEGLALDYAGNIFVTGSFESATLTLGSTTLTNSYPGSEDIFIVKFDPNGNVLWARSGNGTGLEWAIAVTADPFGNVYIAGPFYSDTLSFDGNLLINAYSSFGYEEMFFVKYDSAGNFQWANGGFGNNYFNEIYSLSSDPMGNIFLTGTTTSDTLSFGTTSLSNPLTSYYSMVLAKFDPLGNLVWGKMCGGTSTDYGYSIVADPAGNAYVVGYFTGDTLYYDSIAAVAIDQNTYSDLFLLKVDPNGALIWGKGTGGIYQPCSYGFPQQGLARDNRGNIYTAGNHNIGSVVFGNDTLGPAVGSISPYIARLNDAGECSAAFGIYPDSTTQHLYWILNEASGTGPLTYLWNWGDGNFDTTAYPSHTYAIEGFYPICLTITDSVGCSGTYCYTSYLQRQAYHEGLSNTMVQVNVVASLPVAVQSVAAGKVSVYPNPSSGLITVQNSLGSIRQIEIHNLVGGRIYSAPYPPGVQLVPIDISELNQGIYLVTVQTDAGRIQIKLARQ